MIKWTSVQMGWRYGLEPEDPVHLRVDPYHGPVGTKYSWTAAIGDTLIGQGMAHSPEQAKIDAEAALRKWARALLAEAGITSE